MAYKKLPINTESLKGLTIISAERIDDGCGMNSFEIKLSDNSVIVASMEDREGYRFILTED